MVEEVTGLNELVAIIGMLPETSHTNVIAISGFAGSGKTTLARALHARLESSAVVPVDDFVQPGYLERSSDWACIDRKRLAHDVLQAAERGAYIRYLAYDWSIQELGKYRDIGRPSYVILEGIGIMHPDLIPYFDLTIWIDCPLETAMRRGMQRDREVLRVNHDELWQTVWGPNDQEFFDTYRPDQVADCIYRPKESI